MNSTSTGLSLQQRHGGTWLARTDWADPPPTQHEGKRTALSQEHGAALGQPSTGAVSSGNLSQILAAECLTQAHGIRALQLPCAAGRQHDPPAAPGVAGT